MTIRPVRVDAREMEQAIEQAEKELETPPSQWARPVFVYVPLHRIETKPELFQPRRFDAGYVEDLAARIAQKDSIDPPLVVKIGGQWVCVDGHDRIAAYRKLEPRQVIKCEWFDGTIREAADEHLRNLRRNMAVRASHEQG